MNAEPDKLVLPAMLVDQLDAAKPPLSEQQLALLATMLEHLERPLPLLYDRHGIAMANKLWTSPQLRYYLGAPNSAYVPGDIDPELAWIIGEAEPDSPIALDYRTSPPRVLYLGGVDRRSCWIALSASYEQLMATLTADAERP